jgi:hypothetical protein
MSDNNMRIWRKVEKSDDEFLTQLKHGAKLTAINAQSQIMKAT